MSHTTIKEARQCIVAHDEMYPDKENYYILSLFDGTRSVERLVKADSEEEAHKEANQVLEQMNRVHKGPMFISYTERSNWELMELIPVLRYEVEQHLLGNLTIADLLVPERA